MRIVVAGGSGFLGTPLVARMRTDGHDVLVLTRGAPRDGELVWSPQDAGTGAWARALDGADAVINLAGAPIASGRWSAARRRVIRESRVAATRAIAAAVLAARRPPRVCLNGSAIGLYGDRGDERLGDDASAGTGFLPDVVRAWEAEAQPVSAVSRLLLLRTGVVLAPHGGALPRLALPFRFFAGGRVGSGRQYISWIHLEDWMALVRWALAEAGVSGPLNATAPEPVTNTAFAQTLGRVLGRPAWMPVPSWPVRLLLGEMADALVLEGQRVVPTRALALGFEFRYPALDRALADIYRRRP